MLILVSVCVVSVPVVWGAQWLSPYTLGSR